MVYSVFWVYCRLTDVKLYSLQWCETWNNVCIVGLNGFNQSLRLVMGVNGYLWLKYIVGLCVR